MRDIGYTVSLCRSFHLIHHNGVLFVCTLFSASLCSRTYIVEAAPRLGQNQTIYTSPRRPDKAAASYVYSATRDPATVHIAAIISQNSRIPECALSSALSYSPGNRQNKARDVSSVFTLCVSCRCSWQLVGREDKRLHSQVRSLQIYRSQQDGCAR